MASVDSHLATNGFRVSAMRGAGDAAVSTVLFRSAVLAVGTFDVHPSHPDFERAGQIPAPTVVFPKSSVWIQHEHEAAFATDLNTVNYYNGGRPYLRRALAAEGDHCHRFEFAAPVAREVVSHSQLAPNDELCPFRFTHGPSDRSSYRWQQRVIEYLRRTDVPDVLYVEETMLRVFSHVVAAADKRESVHPQVVPMGCSKREALAEDVRAVLATRFTEPLLLREVANAVGSSEFHICRVFKERTGETVHNYRSELRLRRALNLLPETDDLTQLALDLGYCSHSHFTMAFRRAFGQTPSEIRQLLRYGSRDAARLSSSRS